MTENEQLKVLDLFCGRGGWSKPFIEDGDEVWGIDIKNFEYPGKLIQSDIHQLDGYGFSDMDLIIGSPPCTEFSIAKEFSGLYKRNLEQGLGLVADFYRFVAEAQPKWWAMENVTNLEQWWPEPPIWHFKVSIKGRRSLWGNIPIGMSPEFKMNRAFCVTRESRRKWKEAGRNDIRDPTKRSEIPYPIARFIADTVRRVHTNTRTKP